MKVWFLSLGAGALLLVAVAIAGTEAGWWFSSPPDDPVLAEQPDPSGYQWRERACDFEADWRTDVLCGDLLTPLYVTPEGPRRFRLPVAVLKSDARQRREDPIIYLPGGPGGSAELTEEGIEFWQSWQLYTQSQRDLILIDRRGVGKSDPALTCPEYDRYSEAILSEAISEQQENREAGDILQRCFEQLEASGTFRSDQFGTIVSARDLAALMGFLPYEKYNLVGVSYGTRLALATADLDTVRQAGWVRSLVLDSVYPPDQGGLISWPGVVTHSVERFLAWCEGRAGCAESVADLDALLAEALESLAQEPMYLSIPSWSRDESRSVAVDDRRLFTAMFGAIYDRYRWPDIVEGLRGAVERDAEKLKPLIEVFINQALDGSFSYLTFMAVDCLDHTLGTEAEYVAQLAQYPQYRQYLGRWDSHVCRWLGTAEKPLPTLEPLPIPTLIMAGEQDPVTPAQWARDLAQSWPSAQLYVADNIGHSVLWSDTCAESSLGAFLDNPKAQWTPMAPRGPKGKREPCE
ncbi:alpha/beta hydrolase [Marinimicrobium agarilyticum]|uniref:alpha/beta hydrolase n=1 Tax=Marinimicrobium agarilyticum TaxID=306546 RepID=UPI00041D98BA|nr:alpha/beta hydrolase [Marinimicrobium agarilyticum]